MNTEFTKLSSKGQVVIPLDIRKHLNLKEGTPLAIVTQDDTILLKKMEIPKIKAWKEVSMPFREAAKKSKFTKEELNNLIREARKSIK